MRRAFLLIALAGCASSGNAPPDETVSRAARHLYEPEDGTPSVIAHSRRRSPSPPHRQRSGLP